MSCVLMQETDTHTGSTYYLPPRKGQPNFSGCVLKHDAFTSQWMAAAFLLVQETVKKSTQKYLLMPCFYSTLFDQEGIFIPKICYVQPGNVTWKINYKVFAGSFLFSVGLSNKLLLWLHYLNQQYKCIECMECQLPLVFIVTEWRRTFYRAVRAVGITATTMSEGMSCVMPCDEYLKRVEQISIFHLNILIRRAACSSSHIQISTRQTSTVFRLSFTVFHRLDDSSGFVFTLHFLMSESLPYSPPLGSWNRPSVGGQRVSSDSNPRTLAVIWLPVIPVVPWVCCHRRCFLSRCWQMARWTHSGWLWRLPEWNQNTGPGPLLMECQMPAVRGAGKERWKTAIYHGRWGSRSAAGDCQTKKHSSAPVACY